VTRSSITAVATAALAVLCGLVMVGTAAAATEGTLGPSPGQIQSRCAALVLSSHVGFAGKEISATAGPAMPGSCGGGKVTWTWGVGGKGCQPDSTHCSFRVGASAVAAWESVCIIGTSTQGGWQSCDYYLVPAKGTGIIDGYVKDKDGGPVAGSDITAYGHGYGRRGASATTGADGFYAIPVKAGDYAVFPSGGPRGKAAPTYTPSDAHVHISDGSKDEANFELKSAAIELKLDFAKSSVAANGLEVLKGKITTTEFGKPAPNVQVQLDPLPGTSSANLGLRSPRASICYAGARVWPAGTLNDPDYFPVNVTTDATGHYDFTLTVGTTPGTWRLDAWAYDADGKLSTDTTNASDTKSVTFDSTASGKLDAFVSAFNIYARTSTDLQSAATSANAMIPLLAQAKTTDGNAGPVGYAYALVNAPDGQAMMVFPADQAPSLSKAGDVDTGGDLMYDPAEWTGKGLSASQANPSLLQFVVTQGALPDLPTVTQFDNGTSVTGWAGKHGSHVTISTQSFAYLGWGYPSSTPGACY
jgi:hypothetical protein